MKTKMEQFPSINPNPVLSVAKDGTVLYSNDASEPLLCELGVTVGEKLPPYLIDVVNCVTSINAPQKIEVKAGNRVYSVAFHLLPEEDYVNIYGFDISDQKQLEGKLRETCENLQVQSEELQAQSEELQAQTEELHKANEMLLESEERFRTMANAIPQLAWIAKADGYIYWYNERWYAYTGTTPEQMGGWGWQSVHDPEVLPKVLEQWKASIATGQMFDMEFPLLGADGIFRQFLTRVLPMKANNGRVVQWFGTNTDIAERKRAEEEVKDTSNMLQLIMNNIPQGIFWKDRNSVFLGCNKVLAKVIGVESPENIVGKTDYDLPWTPEQTKWFREYDRRVMESDTPEYHIVEQMQQADGELALVETNKIPLHDSKGNVIGILGTYEDITERNKLEEELKQKVKQYQTLGDTIPYGVWITDAEGYCTYASDSFLELMDMSMEQVQKFGWMHRLPPEDVQPTTDHWLHCVQTGEDFEREHRFRAKDGSYRNVLAIGRPVRNDAGRITEWVGLNLDVTERKHMEEDLRVSEERFRTLAENSPDIIARFDRQKHHIYANPAAAEPYGHSPEKIVGRTNSELGMSHELVKFWEGHYENVFITGKPETMEFQYTSPQGKEYYFNTRIVPEFVDGKVDSVLAISRDNTDIKEAEAKLKETLDSLEEKVKERTAELNKAYKLLKESEEGLAEAQRMVHLGNWDRNLVTGKLYWSDEMYRIFGLVPQEFDATYDAFLSYVHPDDRDYVASAVKGALNGNPLNIDYRIISVDGEECVVHVQGEVVYNEENIPVRTKGTMQDITKRKKAEESLQNSEARLRKFYESGMIGVLYYKMDGSITDANDKFLEMVGYTRDDLRAGRVRWDKMTPPKYYPLEEHVIADLKAIGVATPYEKEYIRKDGSRIPIILGLAIIDEVSDEGIAFVLDITERKEAEKALAKIEIVRKQEIHHRIKNNLQVISSMLDLQAETFRDQDCIKDSEVLKAFRESQNRVISMALIHEELYKGGGFETLNFSPYIEKLAENLFMTYQLGNKDIILNMELEDNLFFDMDTAVPLGIIVNELVSNSLKHAFADRDKGEIQIQLHKEESESDESTLFTLTVSDNGVGIPENIDMEDLESLGLQLVTILVDQLDGELELKRDNGTEFTIRFTVIEKNNTVLSPAAQQSV